MSKKLGIVKEIIDNETIKVAVVSEELKFIKGDRFYIAGLKDLSDNFEPIVINFDDITNEIIEEEEL
ncbi:hypothetical protein [Clostridium butyricum]|uniref:hypothetical protein n=1 Tax=Clostridium butyricum TaxID=1492 RepID=UPI002ABDDAE1|nr:hypothetical protein [Clostridium butyricum]